jgi:hypothetical protein
MSAICPPLADPEGHGLADSSVPYCRNFERCRALVGYLRGTLAMRNRAIDVRSQTKPKADGERICGAMALQHGAASRHDTESVPQKFVRLVGHRDPDTCRAPWIPPRPVTKKL